MADPTGTDPHASPENQASRAREDLNARFQDLRHDAEQNARVASDTLNRRFEHVTGSGDARASAGSAAGTFSDKASQATSDAKSAALSFAEQARGRVNEIIDQQKAAGAEQIAGVARAAQSAASDLDATNPQIARIVRSAAENVDRIADDVRSRDLGDVLDTLAAFGRRQPVAFFGVAVVAGFILARFLKSDAPVVDDTTRPLA